MVSAVTLGMIGEPAVEPLIQALKEKDRYVRKEAAFALGEIADARAVEPLIQSLKDEDLGVQKEATDALEKIREPAVDPL
ncbi:MAG: HEAT repeat domain-containing protein, partial [Candidatus Hodarchaeota archaeon]